MREAQMETARCWNGVAARHRQARAEKGKWPGRDTLQKLTKGKYRLHS
jgi:hypothetical protein